MRVARICPCCGTDIVIDEPILINDFAMNGAGFPLFYRGERVRLTHDQALICWALMKACPGYLSTDAIYERLGSEAEDSLLLARVHISHIRRRFTEQGIPQAIDTVYGSKAYVWNPRA